MVYCMSDIHGETDRFHKMLQLIQFSEEDTLYIIGDVIDRYPGGVDILKEIMATPNMILLMGNHEKMCLDVLGSRTVFRGKEIWFRNGGEITHDELCYFCEPEEKQQIIQFLSQLPYYLDIEVAGKKYHLVHGKPGPPTWQEDLLWNRPHPEAEPFFEDRTAIVGHTPTCHMAWDGHSPFGIWYGDGIIDIDCGCGHQTEYKRLACLRLDDMQEFYV